VVADALAGQDLDLDLGSGSGFEKMSLVENVEEFRVTTRKRA
jgi:hypothetical protein